MKDNLRITAVIPTFNRGHIVGRAIESALAQKFAPAEIIVVDDGSVDNTQSVAESYGQTVRYVHQANGGVAAARNRGVREAKHDWIAFLDSDDYWAPDHLRRMARAITATEGAAALYFADLQVPEGEGGGHRYWQRSGFEITGEWEFKRDAAEWAFMRIQPMMLQASVLSRRVYWEVGGLPEQLRTREDTLLFFKLGLLYPACAVSGCGTVMTSDDSIRLTQVYDGRSFEFCHATILLYRELLTSLQGISREHRQILTECLGSSYYALARVFSRRKDYLSAMKNLAASCRVSPSRFLKEVGGSLARQFFKTTRAADVSGNSLAHNRNA
jgi:glycosyltransferase involved in cell wall biosynthesis